jgi:hypothetical protein
MYASSVLKVSSLPARQDNKNRCLSTLWSFIVEFTSVQSYLIQSLYTTGQSVKAHFNASVGDGWLWWSTTLATQLFEPQPHSFLYVGSHRGYALPGGEGKNVLNVCCVGHSRFEETRMSVRYSPNEVTGGMRWTS